MPYVYRFRGYDVTRDEFVTSKCLATSDFIAKAGCTMIAESATMVGDDELDAEGRYYPDEDEG